MLLPLLVARLLLPERRLLLYEVLRLLRRPLGSLESSLVLLPMSMLWLLEPNFSDMPKVVNEVCGRYQRSDVKQSSYVACLERLVVGGARLARLPLSARMGEEVMSENNISEAVLDGILFCPWISRPGQGVQAGATCSCILREGTVQIDNGAACL